MRGHHSVDGASAMNLWALAIPATIGLLLVNILLGWWITTRRRQQSNGTGTATMLALCWVAIVLNSMHNFDHRSTDAVLSTLTPQTAIEIVLVGTVGAYAVDLLRRGLPTLTIGFALAALPLWVITSATWGGAPAYAFVRGAELAALWVLGVATASVCASTPDGPCLLFVRVARSFLFTTVGLIGLGVLLGPVFVRASQDNLDRFTWAGAHPVNAGYLLGLCLVLLLTSSSQLLGFSTRTHVMLTAIIGAATYANQTRTVAVSVVACALFMLVRSLRRNPRYASLGLVVTAAGALAASSALGAFILRGGDTDKLWTLNNRTELWSVGFERLQGFGDWVLGLGYGASRVVFVDEFAFATSAHNSLLAALVDLGLVGAAILLLLTFGTLARARRVVRTTGSPLGIPLVAIVAYLIVVGATSDLLLAPGLGAAGIYLVAAVSTAASLAPGPHRDEPAPHEDTEPMADVVAVGS